LGCFPWKTSLIGSGSKRKVASHGRLHSRRSISSRTARLWSAGGPTGPLPSNKRSLTVGRREQPPAWRHSSGFDGTTQSKHTRARSLHRCSRTKSAHGHRGGRDVDGNGGITHGHQYR